MMGNLTNFEFALLAVICLMALALYAVVDKAVCLARQLDVSERRRQMDLEEARKAVQHERRIAIMANDNAQNYKSLWQQEINRRGSMTNTEYEYETNLKVRV